MGASSHEQPGAAAAVVGGGGGGVEGPSVEGAVVSVVEGGVEPVDELGGDLLAQDLGDQATGNKVLVGSDLAGQAVDGAAWVTLVDGLVRGMPGQDPAGLVSGEGPSGCLSRWWA